MEQFIGCDAHKKFSVFVAVNEKGQAGEALRVNHERPLYREFLARLPPGSAIASELACRLRRGCRNSRSTAVRPWFRNWQLNTQIESAEQRLEEHCQVRRAADVLNRDARLLSSRLRLRSRSARRRRIAIARFGDSANSANGVLLGKDCGQHRGARETVAPGQQI